MKKKNTEGSPQTKKKHKFEKEEWNTRDAFLPQGRGHPRVPSVLGEERCDPLQCACGDSSQEESGVATFLKMIATPWKQGKISGVCLQNFFVATMSCPENACLYRIISKYIDVVRETKNDVHNFGKNITHDLWNIDQHKQNCLRKWRERPLPGYS